MFQLPTFGPNLTPLLVTPLALTCVNLLVKLSPTHQLQNKPNTRIPVLLLLDARCASKTYDTITLNRTT